MVAAVSYVVWDTSVVIDPTGLGEWGDVVPVLSAVTLAELHAGLGRGTAFEQAERRRRLNRLRASSRVIPFGIEEAEAYGLLVAMSAEAGRRHRGRALDLQIAATAVVAGVPLLTRNAADLVGLERAVKIVAL